MPDPIDIKAAVFESVQKICQKKIQKCIKHWQTLYKKKWQKPFQSGCSAYIYQKHRKKCKKTNINRNKWADFLQVLANQYLPVVLIHAVVIPVVVIHRVVIHGIVIHAVVVGDLFVFVVVFG